MNLHGKIQIWNDKVDLPVKNKDWVWAEEDDDVDKMEEKLRNGGK